ncbi:hypothetical protein [Flavobacterium sp. CF136]|uniref:hypothetical protein n=1 Tax=Flavobacterium sp. (strain CF136) TaxID=1144313 RepID=UPI0002719F0A|nr:hypothetical protein [Flavobacterium sp. CF136]EJL66296.1 hypothetical protein PMI10_00644 [Flavobacterium sp. CF136]
MPNKLKNIPKKIVIWWKAEILDYPYWRVSNQDDEWIGGFTYKINAKRIAKSKNGKFFIDYNFIIMRDHNSK